MFYFPLTVGKNNHLPKCFWKFVTYKYFVVHRMYPYVNSSWAKDINFEWAKTTYLRENEPIIQFLFCLWVLESISTSLMFDHKIFMICRWIIVVFSWFIHWSKIINWHFENLEQVCHFLTFFRFIHVKYTYAFL